MKINKNTNKRLRFGIFILILLFIMPMISNPNVEVTNDWDGNLESSADWENETWTDIPLYDDVGDPLFNYATYLSGSILYYEGSKCGVNEGNNRLNWRGDCHTEDGRWVTLSDGTEYWIDATGGYHDAGDHIKFGICEAYSASTLGWGFIEFQEQYEETGQDVYLLETLKYFTDYFIRCHPEPEIFLYHVGSGSDHNYWGPPELQSDEDCPRDTLLCTPETPASDVCGNTAAALAQMYIIYQDIDLAYAEVCLQHALDLYAMGTTYHGLGNGYGFYSSATFYDDLSWGAIWLYKATGDASYLDDIASNTYAGAGGLDEDSNIDNGINWVNYWTHCWDTVWGGVFVVAAEATQHPAYIEQAEANIEFWMSPNLMSTAGGLKYLNSWGVLRYSSAEALMALVHYKNFGNETYRDFAASQMNYACGSNPLEMSYFVGIGDVTAEHPHHRAAHGSETLSMTDPENHKHTLWGALVGGPDTSDAHNDVTWDYISNEVTIDYNAAAVGALAGMRKYFNPTAMPEELDIVEDEIEEIYMEAKIESINDQRTQFTAQIHNHDIHPVRFEDQLNFRYFVDLTEVLTNYSIEDVDAEVYYNQVNAGTISEFLPFDEENNIYYVEVHYHDYPFYGYMEFQVALVFNCPNSQTYEEIWDGTNDHSYQTMTDEYSKNYYMPIYRDGVLIWGIEPSGGVNSPPSISSPGDISYDEGDTGNSISWTATDTNPDTYIITQDGITVDSGSWSSGNIISTSVDGLTADIYTYVITVVDTEGLSNIDSVDVIVSPVVNIAPIVSSPIDISFNEGDIGNSITWFITDTNPDTYIITQDGITVDSGSWASESEITISLDGLTEGTYTFIIIVADDEGLSASDSVDVTVSIGSAGLYGDVNNDGSVSIVDALLVAQYYVGEAVSIDEILADVNLDGFITIVDALLIAQYYVGTISELPFLG